MQGRILTDIKRGIPPAAPSVTRSLFVERPWVLISRCWSLESAARPVASTLVDKALCTPYLTSEPLTCILRLSTEDLTQGEWHKDRTLWYRRVKHLKDMCQVSKTWCAHAMPLLLQDTDIPGRRLKRTYVPVYIDWTSFVSDYDQKVSVFRNWQQGFPVEDDTPQRDFSRHHRTRASTEDNGDSQQRLSTTTSTIGQRENGQRTSVGDGRYIFRILRRFIKVGYSLSQCLSYTGAVRSLQTIPGRTVCSTQKSC